MALYREALDVDGVAGLIIGTRPDCMPQDLLDRLAGLREWVMVEYGAESACDRTLELVNRCHTWADTVDAVNRTHAAGLPCGLHLIMGLPGEDEATMLETVDCINELPVDTVKFHQLQLVRGTEWLQTSKRGYMTYPVLRQRSISVYASGYLTGCARILRWSVLCRSLRPTCLSIRAGD